MLQYNAKEIESGLYLIKDPLDVNMYLIVGESEALLFDTGYGVGDLAGFVKTITDKPLTVVLGHGHIDHANGACQFSEGYLREEDFDLCDLDTSPETRDMILFQMRDAGLDPGFDKEIWRSAGKCSLKPLMPDTVFGLGDLHVRVVDMAGHTGGSIGLLLVEKRILLDSDSANSHCWMFMEQSLSLRDYIDMLKRVKMLDFDTFFVAHQDHPHPKSDFDKYIRVAGNASVDKSEPYSLRAYLTPYIYTQDDVSIVFNERTLNG